MRYGYGPDGGITLATIRHAKPDALQHAATALGKAARELHVHHEHYTYEVQQPMGGGLAWSGHGQPEAHGVTTKTAGHIDALHHRITPAETALRGFGHFLHSAKRKVSDVEQRARRHHLTVSDTGEVDLDHVPGEHPADTAERKKTAARLYLDAHAILTAAKHADAKAAGTLSALQRGDVFTAPPASVVDPSYWSQEFGKESFWRYWTSKALAVPSMLQTIEHTYGKKAALAIKRGIETGDRASRSKAAKNFRRERKVGSWSDRFGAAGRFLSWKYEKPVLKDIPLVNTGVTVGGIAWDHWHNHESWGKSIMSNVLPTAASIGAGAGTEAVLSAAVPEMAAGPEAGAVLLAGTGAAVGVGWVVKHWHAPPPPSTAPAPTGS